MVVNAKGELLPRLESARRRLYRYILWSMNGTQAAYAMRPMPSGAPGVERRSLGHFRPAALQALTMTKSRRFGGLKLARC
jgi:hypothetical protein